MIDKHTTKAVALRYDHQKEQAPKVRAKGKAQVAEGIIAFAKKNNIQGLTPTLRGTVLLYVNTP